MIPATVFLVISGVTAIQTSVPRLDTPWTSKVSKTLPHPEYPRPQLVRKNWTNLNGPWDFAMVPTADIPDRYPKKILVPFPVESKLSGVAQSVSANMAVWYRRAFTAPKGEKTLLHFGASDWKTQVWVNGQAVGTHTGGFDSFTFDITRALKAGGSQEVTVKVEDPSDDGPQPRGKQVRNPGGIFYTPTTGIWQTVWVEGVPKRSIDRLKTSATNDGTVTVQIQSAEGSAFAWAEIREKGKVVARTTGKGTLKLKVRKPKLWEPGSPTLYDLKVGLDKDTVDSYFAFREMKLGKDARGRTNIQLNGKPIFMVGPLDQGFWPDGIYTAPTEAAMRYDVDVTKRLGFNTIRKHVKVEPETWYAYCDRVGMLVWQDMPSGYRSIGSEDPDLKRNAIHSKIFERELKAMMDQLHEHPSIVSWVLFNEGWGQYDTARLSTWVKKYDPSRILNAVTGWADRGTGDLIDWHVYPGPGSPKPEAKRAASLGEFGGLGLPTPGHMWEDKNWGYQTFKNKEDLTAAFENLFLSLRFLKEDPGLSTAIYTQTTDVETEANGLMTYDRRVLKMDAGRVRRAVTSIFGPPMKLTTLVPSADEKASNWSYTTEKPFDGWQKSAFDTSGWMTGPGGFGTKFTPNTTVRTEWSSPDIWVRRSFSLAKPAGDLYLRLYHDEDAEVYIDGNLVQKLPGYTASYQLLGLRGLTLAGGNHSIAIHCHQTAGGQYIDAGLVQAR